MKDMFGSASLRVVFGIRSATRQDGGRRSGWGKTQQKVCELSYISNDIDGSNNMMG